jgi:Terminase RNaseH-like domain
VQAYHEFKADRIIAEENFGGEMVRFVIRAADAHASVQVISASRGKVLRAEPVSALYERGLVHHVGRFAVLEDQLCAFTTQGYRGEGSPDHADALVFAVTELMLKENASILEFYRRQADGRQRTQADVGETVSAPVVRLQAPIGVSVVHGFSGAYYVVGADRVVAVRPDDVAPLLGAGFARVAADDG